MVDAAREGRGVLRFVRPARRAIRGIRLPVIRPIVATMYGTVEASRVLWNFLVKLIYREPVLRYHCASVGRRLHLEGPIPEIFGSGRIQIGDDVTIGSPCTWDLAHDLGQQPEIVIGNRVSINYRNIISAAKSVRIGDDTMLAGEVLIFDNISHPVSPRRRLARESLRRDEAAPVTIGRNVWVGVGAMILRGVTIGDNSVIAARSVVTKSVPPNCLVAGNPARVVKEIVDA
jgi:carbonic anhydrase/acetyltransferase-like protein (isoleucine patch superfamily)